MQAATTVREHVRVGLCARLGGRVHRVPGVSDDETDDPTDNEADPATGGPPVGRLREAIVTRVPGAGYNGRPPSYAQLLADDVDRDQFVGDGMDIFRQTFGRTTAADDPGVMDRARTGLANVFDDRHRGRHIRRRPLGSDH
jgi:hypothetical protein